MNCDTLLFICESASSWWNIFVANKKWWKLAFRSACNGCSILRWIQYFNDFKGTQFRTGPFIKWLCVFRAHQNSRWVRTWRCTRLSAPSRWFSRFSWIKKRKGDSQRLFENFLGGLPQPFIKLLCGPWPTQYDAAWPKTGSVMNGRIDLCKHTATNT